MRAPRLLAKLCLATTACAAVGIGAVALTPQTAEAVRPPQPECGPTYLWICSGRGGDVFFSGTICEKESFERKTHRTCVPYGG